MWTFRNNIVVAAYPEFVYVASLHEKQRTISAFVGCVIISETTVHVQTINFSEQNII